MGCENWLLFKSPKEARRAQAFLAPLDGEVSGPGRCGCWLIWKGAQRLEIGVNAGSYESSIHDFVRREICLRFDVQKIGADSTGWYPESDWQSVHPRGAPARYPGFTSWVQWAKSYKPEWSHALPDPRWWPEATFQADYDATLKFLQEVEAHVSATFARLDGPQE